MTILTKLRWLAIQTLINVVITITPDDKRGWRLLSHLVEWTEDDKEFEQRIDP